MKFVNSAIAVIVGQVLLLSLGWNWLGIQPVLIFVLAFGFRLDAKLVVAMCLGAGALAEWFNPGANGEIFGIYVLVSLLISWLQKNHRYALRSTSNVLSFLFGFSAILTISVFAAVSSNPSPAIAVFTIWQFGAMLLSNAVVLVPLHLYNLKQANGQI